MHSIDDMTKKTGNHFISIKKNQTQLKRLLLFDENTMKIKILIYYLKNKNKKIGYGVYRKYLEKQVTSREFLNLETDLFWAVSNLC